MFEQWLKKLVIAKVRAKSTNIKNALGSHEQTVTVNGVQNTYTVTITQKDITEFLSNPTKVA
jgi:Na+-transporting NADH:ubiquinone oxidoreductase subunit NqrC